MYKIAVIGLGYVGLPLAHAFASKYEVVGFDIAEWRIEELRKGIDRTLELSEAQVNEAIANKMLFTNKLEEISTRQQLNPKKRISDNVYHSYQIFFEYKESYYPNSNKPNNQ
ncbi:MAG: UDP-glucose dehydrogenase (EC, partial [uncultured Sulfurovum sp.]